MGEYLRRDGFVVFCNKHFGDCRIALIEWGIAPKHAMGKRPGGIREQGDRCRMNLYFSIELSCPLHIAVLIERTKVQQAYNLLFGLGSFLSKNDKQ